MNEEAPINFTEERVKNDWSLVLGTRHGRSVVMDILRMCHYGVSPFTGDDNTTNMISGKQKVAEGVTEMMNAIDAKAFIKMLTEAQEDNLNDRAKSKPRDED